MKEKRKVERFNLHIEAMLNFQHEAKKAPKALILSRNISCDGVFLETNNPLPIGTKVDLNLLLNQHELSNQAKDEIIKINTSGKVVRTNEEGMAVEFDKLHKVSQLK